jgi:hypothetical protein
MKYARLLGVAVVAAMALTAFVGAASASAAKFHSTVSNVAVSGSQVGEHVFTTQGQKVTCKTATFTGNAEGTESEIQKVHPEYGTCTAFGFEAKVNTAGCMYKFNANTTLASGTEAPVALEGCTSGHVTISVEIPFVATCEVQVPVTGNSAINGQKYVNKPNNTTHENIEVVTSSTNIVSNVTKASGLCPLHTETGAISKYEGHTLVKPASGTIWWA